MDEALLVFRGIFALMVAGHASQKLFGWFRGKGIAGTAVIFELSGLKPGRPMVLMAGLLELAAAASIGFGFLTGLGAIGLLTAMIVAAATLRHNGFWGHMGGFEVAFSYGLIAVLLAWIGPGSWSVDAFLNLEAYGWWVAGLGLLLAVIGSSPLLIMIEKHRKSQSAS